MLLLTEYLPRERFDVSFVLLGGMTDMAAEAERLGATVHALGAPRRAGSPMPVFAAKVGRRVVDYVALCRRERYDIVDAWLYLGYGLVAVTRKVSRVPVFIAGRRSLSAFKADHGFVERTVDAIARRSADAIVGNSQAVADDVAQREGIDPARIRVIRNGVILPPVATPAERATVRATFGIEGDGPVIGCVGTFQKKGKGQARVVDVVAAARQRRPDVWLVFVGDGPERASVEARAVAAGLQRVRFLGSVPDARATYDGLDIVISASDAEGLPNVVLEAAAAARPIVATDAGGTREIVLDGSTGVLVPLGDTDGLVTGLLTLLERPDLAERYGDAARAHVGSAFGVDRFVRETADLYEELHARRAHGERFGRRN